MSRMHFPQRKSVESVQGQVCDDIVLESLRYDFV